MKNLLRLIISNKRLKSLDNNQLTLTSQEVHYLNKVSVDYVKIEELIIGGENSDWLVEDHPDSIFNN